jgi:hypothetical protein
MTVVVASDRGLEVEGDAGTAEELAGREVGPLAVAPGRLWAIVDGREIWTGNGRWEPVATWTGPRLTCVLATAGELTAGTAEAHVLRLDGDALVADKSFDDLPERADWYTPWGGPADTRSLAGDDDTVLVNIHVGGIARSDGGGPWRALVDIDVDVHQVVIAPDGSYLAASGAAGFGRSTDGGSNWAWDADGLHGSYCRAVAVAGDHVLLSASTGPGRSRGALYRRPLGAGGAWDRVSELVDGNIDTFLLAAAGEQAAFVTEAGVLWTSDDAGATWRGSDQSHGRARGVAIC